MVPVCSVTVYGMGFRTQFQTGTLTGPSGIPVHSQLTKLKTNNCSEISEPDTNMVYLLESRCGLMNGRRLQQQQQLLSGELRFAFCCLPKLPLSRCATDITLCRRDETMLPQVYRQAAS